MEHHARTNDRSIVRWRRLVVPASIVLFLSACGQTSGDPTPATDPGTTINGRVAPDANGNNRDQPMSTSPVSPSP